MKLFLFGIFIVCFFGVNNGDDYLPNIDVRVYRDDKTVLILQCDNINNEVEATEIIIEDKVVPILKKNTFSKLENLKYLRLVNNSIGDIQAAAFNRLPKLRAINLDFNRIQNIEKGVFKDLPLTKLSLKANGLVSIKDGAFDLPHLEFLDLSSNHLKEIRKEIFSERMGNIREINLSFNRLTTFSEKLFGPLFAHFDHAHKVINLNDNQLAYLPKNAFKGVNHINMLLLNNNNLNNLNHHSFNDVTINSLYLSGNNLKYLHGSFMRDIVLGFIDLENNPLACDFIVKFKNIMKAQNISYIISENIAC